MPRVALVVLALKPNNTTKSKGRAVRKSERIATKIEQTSAGKAGICKKCGEPFAQVWKPGEGVYTSFKNCGNCRMEQARGQAKAEIPYTPHAGGQVLVHASEARFKLIAAGARWGKDRCMIMEFVKKFCEMLSEDRGPDMIPAVHGWIIAPTFALARQTWRELKAYFPREWIVNIWESDKMLETVNDGLIEVRSADDPNMLVGVGLDIVLITEAARIARLDEVWPNLETRLMSPGRGPSGTGGVALINSCVVGDTIIYTEKGMTEISKISDMRKPKGYESCGLKIAGYHGKPQVAVDFYYNGFSETKKITTRAGYCLEGTPNHPIRTMNKEGMAEWKRLDEVKEGDWIPVRRGMNYWGSDDDISGFVYANKRLRPKDHGEDVDLSKMTPELAYLMGLILGDGYVDYKQGKAVIAHSDEEHETIEFLLGQPHKLQFNYKHKQHTEACSKRFTAFLEWYGFKPGIKAKGKTIPDRLFAAPKWVVANFLSGLFDADGHSKTRNGRVGYHSSSEKLIKQVQQLLLNFGIISRLAKRLAGPTKRVKVYSLIWSLDISPKDSLIFYKEIGFRLSRKQNNQHLIVEATSRKHSAQDGVPMQTDRISRILKGAWYKNNKGPNGLFGIKNQKMVGYQRIRQILNICSCSDATDDIAILEGMCRENYYWDQIKTVEDGYAETFDFVIPVTHAFVSNGLISHNTPRGRTFYYNMFKWGQKDDPDYDKDWESWQFASFANPHLSTKDKAYLIRMKNRYPERIYNQEILAIFLAEGNSVFPTADDCAIYTGGEDPEIGESYIIGYDPARSIDYSGVIVRNSRGQVVRIEQWQGRPWTRQMDDIAFLSRHYNYAHVVIDRTGLGETLPEALMQRGLSVEAVYMSNAEKEKMVNNLAMLIEQKFVTYPKHDTLINELKDYEYAISKTGTTRYSASTKSRHDDLVTALFLAFKDFNNYEMELPFVGLLGGIPRLTKKKVS